jgi:hypothetical protein
LLVEKGEELLLLEVSLSGRDSVEMQWRRAVIIGLVK